MLSIVHDVYTAFDAYPTLESRVYFLFFVLFCFYISKPFDKVWHEGLIFKLKSMEVSNTLVELIKSFLKNRFQRFVLNSQTPEWLLVKAGVPQGSILAPLFFLIYINDLSNDIVSTVKLFADDISLFSIVHDAKT